MSLHPHIPALPEQVVQQLLLDKPATTDFFSTASRQYLHGIANYFTGAGDRPTCTVANVAAAVGYPEYRRVIDVLAQDPQMQFYVASMRTALQQGAEKQVAGIIATLQLDLSGLNPGPEAAACVASFFTKK